MANNITNIITATDMNKLKSLLVNEKGEITFEIISPRPKALDITSGGVSYKHGENLYIDRLLSIVYNPDKNISTRSPNEDVAELIKLIKEEKHTTSMEHVENYIRGYENLRRYGCVDWYEWNIANWGTKWDAYEDVMEEDGTYIQFETAWSTPDAFLKKLAEHIDFKLVYADEDIFGENAGAIEFVKGKMKPLRAFKNIDKVSLGFAVTGISTEPYEEDDEDDYDINHKTIVKAEQLIFKVFGKGTV